MRKRVSIPRFPFQPNPFIKYIYILDPDGVKIRLVENIWK
jgi:lactoylglutathione lyase